MAEIKYLSDTGLQTVIDKNATLANGARAAGDYDNGTELDFLCDVFLENFHFDTSAPSAGVLIADLYVLRSEPDDTTFPQGGDGSVGGDVTPQAAHYVGSFETRNPSTTVEETLSLHDVPLGPHDNRFVVVNTSGQTFTDTWQLSIVPHKYQTV